MRKRIIDLNQQDTPTFEKGWLNVEELAEVEITSEDKAHPIEFALLPGRDSGWRASTSGKQLIRFLFPKPQKIQRIWLKFVETSVERTQEFVLRWSPDGGKSFHEIVRQQWNFSPNGSTTETEDHCVDLSGVTMLELSINPDIGSGNKFATLAQLRLA